MSVLQELIVKFNANKNAQLYARIIRELQNTEKLWIAFSPSSKNYFLGNENDRAAAYIFSEEHYYDVFYVHQSQKGYDIKPVENSAQYRMALFADLYRSGFEAIVIDNGQTYLRLDLFDIIQKPQPQKENKNAKLIVNPALMRTACWFFQENARTPATPEMWKLLFTDIFKAEYIVPADTSKVNAENGGSGQIKVGKDSEVLFPVLQNAEGKRYYPFFTDWNELRKYDMDMKYSALAASFTNLEDFAEDADGIVINPYGTNIVLTAEMLRDIKNASSELKKKKSEVMVGDPKEYPAAMTKAIGEYFSEIPDVNGAYLKLMLKDSNESYLVAVEYSGKENPTDLYNKTAQIAIPHAGGIPIDFIDANSEFAKKAIKNTKPFYRK